MDTNEINKIKTNNEIWKNVAYKDYEHYEVSNYSRVKNKLGKLMKPAKNQCISLYKDKNTKLYKAIYEISLFTFKGDKPDNIIKYTVDHIDQNYYNNYIDNLKWATASEQSKNKTNTAKINRNPFIYIKNNEEKIFYNLKLVAKEFNIHVETLRSRLKDKDSIELNDGILKKNNLIANDIKVIPDWIYKEGYIPKKKYYASSNGLILITKRWTLGCKNRPEIKQYYSITLAGKTYRVHVLIAAAFLGKPQIDDKKNKYIVNHIDNNGLNNNLNNLEYLSNSDNCKHAVLLGICNTKPVLCYSIEGKFIKEYSSIKNAEDSLGITNSDIGRVCNPDNNKYFTCQGFQWKFKNNDEILSKIESYSNSVQKKICKYDLDGNYIKTHLSITEASKDENIVISSISLSCKSECKKAGNYLWRTFTDNNFVNKIEPYKNKKTINVTRYNLEGHFIKTYKSIKEAEDDLQISSSSITKACKGFTKCYKSLWRYGDSDKSILV